MLQLIFSILALLVGVALCACIQKRPSWLSFFDAFVVVSIVGLVLFHIIPHCIAESGVFGVATVAVGFGIPALFHRRSHSHGHNAHCDGVHNEGEKNRFAQFAMMTAVIIGMCAHTILDGIGLSMGDMSERTGAAGDLLSVSVLFHRLPVGVFLSLMLVPRIGTKKTWAVAAAMALSTAVGYGLGHFALPRLSMTILNLVQGIIAGMLLHVVFHNVSVGGARECRYAKGIGALLGIAAFAFMTWIVPIHAHQHASPFDLWMKLLYDAAPLWAIFAVILAVCYKLKRSDHGRIARFANRLCRYVDPQARPVAAGGSIHIFCAANFVALFALFDWGFAATWWISVATSALLAYLWLPICVECSMCERVGHCDTEKSFATWTMTSFGTLAGTLLIAAIIPFLTAPMTDALSHLPTFATNAVRTTFLVLYLGFHAFMTLRRHGMHTDFMGYHAHILLMFGLLCAFNFGEFNATRFLFVAILAAYGIAFLSYAESPMAIPASASNRLKSPAKFATGLSIALVLFVILGLQTQDQTRSSFIQAITSEATATMIHDESDAPDNPIDFDAHNHDHSPPLSHEPHEFRELRHDVSERAHDPEHDHGHGIATFFYSHNAWDALRLSLFAIFMLTGLYWIFRVGPRDLFVAKSKHHHYDPHDD